MDGKKIIFLVIFLSLLIFIVGIMTDLKFSDEIFHFWLAKDWFIQQARPVYNKIVDTVEENQCFRFYVHGPLWQSGFVFLWKIYGDISKNIIQFYQAFIYFLLLIFTYLLTVELYKNKKIAFYATIITGTLPLFAAFGILLFEEVPIAMLTILCLLLLVKHRFFLAGIIMGLMFLTKRNSYLLFPVFALLCFGWKGFYDASLRRRFLNIFLFSLITLLIVFPDFKWRKDHLGGLIIPNDKGKLCALIGTSISLPLLSTPIASSSQQLKYVNKQPKIKSINFLPETIHNPYNLPKYLGIIFPLLFLFYLLHIKTLFHERDIILLLPITIYIPLMLFFFKGWLGYRYLASVFPMATIISCKALEKMPRKYLIPILSLCFLQFFSTLYFVDKERKVSPSETQYLTFIKNNTHADDRLLTPEELFISFYTERPTIWVNSFNYSGLRFDNMFWSNETQKILNNMRIKYLVVEKKRIYVDSRIRHYGGWPKSFVDKLAVFPFLEKVFENDAVSIWKVKS